MSDINFENETRADGLPVRELQEDVHAGAEGEMNLDMILNVPVTLSIEVGRARISIGELMKLSAGSVVSLDRLVGEPHDVLVNGTLIAQCEVVVVNEQFGIRFTDIISPSERVKKLQ